ncbi:DUF805 domain-containing protein [Aureisphaera galaxeae]|uniref:DUF805 domain-containing protein n=1 Tax=Aureisphaera galaxeae TaxID=1538023 RepID=UPI002350BEFF|nr:DUF805 domain-containing protein [Aureisphaera galaxeae]MDC8005705.1 DUF805 domain-containing protein [Aureisphaera galaxeae]
MRSRKKEVDYTIFDWWFRAFYDNYDLFKGRARRKEFWSFFLINSASIILLLAITGLLTYLENDATYIVGVFLILLMGFSAIVLLLPFITVSVRRLHDTGKSGWWTVLFFIPYVNFAGLILLLFFWANEGEKGPNQYGVDPKDISDSEIDQIGTE